MKKLVDLLEAYPLPEEKVKTSLSKYTVIWTVY